MTELGFINLQERASFNVVGYWLHMVENPTTSGSLLIIKSGIFVKVKSHACLFISKISTLYPWLLSTVAIEISPNGK